MNNDRNKITFRKILVNPKLGYNRVGWSFYSPW
jgi:hypothetical protein